MSNEHTVKSYEEELQFLVDSVIKMGSLTESQMVDSMDAIIKVDKDSIDKGVTNSFALLVKIVFISALFFLNNLIVSRLL